MWDFLLDVIFPRQCVSCGSWGQFICNQCQSTIDYFDLPAGGQVCPYCEKPSPYGFTHPRCRKPYGLDGMFVLAHYRGPVVQIIHQIKYQGVYGLAEEVAQLIFAKYHNNYPFDDFVPVPLSPKRERKRGFNQAEKLARSLSQNLSSSNTVPVANILQRTKDTRPQFDLKYEDRKNNLRNAFALSSKLLTTNLSGLNFCLVDDVATTGATIFECAKILKRAGAQKVWAICLARGG